MSERDAIEAAMNHFARTRIALNAKVLGLEPNEDGSLWIGVAVTPTGSHRLLARKGSDGAWQVSRHIGSISR